MRSKRRLKVLTFTMEHIKRLPTCYVNAGHKYLIHMRALI